MTARTKPAAKRDRYMELIRQFPLRPIRTDLELGEAAAVMDLLLDQQSLDQDEEDYLEVLSDQVERYEAEHVEIKPVSDSVMLRHLIEAKGVTQTEVAAGAGIAESTISAVLAGRRKLTRLHIGKLAKYFHVEPTLFACAD